MKTTKIPRFTAKVQSTTQLQARAVLLILKILLWLWNVEMVLWRPSWWWSFGSWINNYLCNQCLSPLTLWVRFPPRRGLHDTTLCDKICQWLVAGGWFSPGMPVFFHQ